jgi:hypothetical protein
MWDYAGGALPSHGLQKIVARLKTPAARCARTRTRHNADRVAQFHPQMG